MKLDISPTVRVVKFNLAWYKNYVIKNKDALKNYLIIFTK
jgi:hypothetical protein